MRGQVAFLEYLFLETLYQYRVRSLCLAPHILVVAMEDAILDPVFYPRR